MTIDARKRFDVVEIREKYPIAAVAAGYGIELRPSGRALVGLCPLHDDHKKPNLWVYPVTRSWFCWACKKGGDVIQFVALKEDIRFIEACEWLEGSSLPPVPTGVAPSTTSAPEPHRRRWDRLTLEEQAVMNTACSVYRDCLWREPRARAYLRQRALPDWVLRQCSLGFADGHSLAHVLRDQPDLRIAEELGLLRAPEPNQVDSRHREFFAGRLVVPEVRARQCVWFIGRAPEDRPGQPKYLALNGERPVLGLEQTVGRSEVFLCEGVFDFLTAVSWNLPAFSPCGTHLPADRMGFLAGARVVYGVLDGDAAGAAAGSRFREQLGPRFRAIQLPDGCDLNDLGRRAGGHDEFLRLLAATRQAHEEVNHGE